MKNNPPNQFANQVGATDFMKNKVTVDKADFTSVEGKVIVSDLEHKFGTTAVFVKIPKVTSLWLNEDVKRDSLHKQFRQEIESILVGIAYEAFTFITDEETQQKFLSELDPKSSDVTFILPVCGNIAYTLSANKNVDIADVKSLDEVIDLMQMVVLNFDIWVSHYFKLNVANEPDHITFENQTSYIFSELLELVRQAAERFFDIGSATFREHNNQQREEVSSSPQRERKDNLTKPQVH